MPAADLILKNARVITLDAARPAAEAVAVSGGKIVLAAGNAEVDDWRGPGTRLIDCRGRTLVPGFNDAHCHVFSLLRKQLSIDLSPAAVGSIEEMKAVLRNRAAETPPGEWLYGTDYNEFYLAEKRHPTRRDIDQAVPDHPVVLSHRSLHACVLNSRALELAAIDRATEEPPGGRIEREVDTGEPSGLLFEMLGYIRHQVLPPVSAAELERSAALADHHYLSLGLTSLQDATITNDLDRWRFYQRLRDEKRLHSRLSVMAGPDSLEQFLAAGMATGYGDDRLRLGAMKLMVTLESGRTYPAQDELNALVSRAHRAGFQLAIHAMEPEAVMAAALALEQALEESPKTGHRHRIEHCSECPPELLVRLQRLGVVIVSQPPFLHYSGERYLATIPPERLRWLYRFKSFLSGGLVTAASSDSPIVPDGPLAGIYAAVTRRAENGRQITPQECVTVGQALAMYTTNAAYASFEEDIKGSISAGRLADMVLLSDDPTRVGPEQIRDIGVEMTIVGGEVVWQA